MVFHFRLPSLSIVFSRFIHVVAYTVCHSFLWLNNIPLCGYATFCLSIHLLMDIWIVSTFWVLWRELLWTFVYKFLLKHLFTSFRHISRSRIIASYSNSKFNLLRNHQTVFHSGYTILHPHQKCMSLISNYKVSMYKVFYTHFTFYPPINSVRKVLILSLFLQMKLRIQ